MTALPEPALTKDVGVATATAVQRTENKISTPVVRRDLQTLCTSAAMLAACRGWAPLKAGHAPTTQHRGQLQPKRHLTLKQKACVQARELPDQQEGRLLQSNIQHKPPQTQGSCERHLHVWPELSASDIPVPEKGKHLNMVGGSIKQTPDSCSPRVLFYQICRNGWTVTIFSSVSINQFICRLNRFISLCLHFYIYKMEIESAGFLFGKVF